MELIIAVYAVALAVSLPLAALMLVRDAIKDRSA